MAGAGVPLPLPPLPVGCVFMPTDEELLRHYSKDGFQGLIGTLPYGGDMYLLRPDQIPVQGEGRKQEQEDNGLRTITTEWLVITYKFSEHHQHHVPIEGGVWIADEKLVPVKYGRNETIGFNHTIRFGVEGEEPKSFWKAVEVIPPNDQANTVACRLIKEEIEPIFSMDEEDATLTFEKLIDGGINDNQDDFDG